MLQTLVAEHLGGLPIKATVRTVQEGRNILKFFFRMPIGNLGIPITYNAVISGSALGLVLGRPLRQCRNRLRTSSDSFQTAVLATSANDMGVFILLSMSVLCEVPLIW